MARPTDFITSSTHNGDPQAAEADVTDATSDDADDVEVHEIDAERDSSGRGDVRSRRHGWYRRRRRTRPAVRPSVRR